MRVVDLVRLATDRSSHHGLLVVYRQNDPTRDLKATDTVKGVQAIAELYPSGAESLILAVNHFAAASAADAGV